MIDYIPQDIPPAIVKYADEHYKKPEDATGKYYKFLCTWKGNLEVYIATWRYKSLGPDKRGQPILRPTGLPTVLLYDCHDVRRPTLEETWDIHFFMPMYYIQSKKAEHICHRDLEAFKDYKTPNPYKQRPKYITPRYIPKTVVKYVNQQYPISWYPGYNTRYTKYLTTYQDKYEVYFVYWANPKTKKRSIGKYVLFDCENVRGYKDNKERVNLIFSAPIQYKSNLIPAFCKDKNISKQRGFLQRH